MKKIDNALLDWSHIRAKINSFKRDYPGFKFDDPKRSHCHMILFERDCERYFVASQEYPVVLLPGRSLKTKLPCILIYVIPEGKFFRINDERLFVKEQMLRGFRWDGVSYKYDEMSLSFN